VLVLVLVAAGLVRVLWLSSPNNALIFDELYYVNAARTMIGLPVPDGQPYAGSAVGLDPNREHPPLGKALIAGSMLLLGDTPLGWRLPSLVAGMASLILIDAIVLGAGGEVWLAVLATALFAFDNLALVHSRIGTLDMLLTALMLLAAWCAVRGWSVWAGIACGVAALIKLSGAYGLLAAGALAAIETFWSWRATRRLALRSTLGRFALLITAFALTWLGGLWLLDRQFTLFAAPWDHLQYMLQYGLELARAQGPANSESAPWQWLLNEVQMTYLRVDTQVLVNGTLTETRPIVFFRGAMNPIVIGAAPLALAYALWSAWRTGDRLALWVVTWVLATYLPYYALDLLAHRIAYLFYFLPTLPAVAVGLAMLLRRSGLPGFVTVGYLVGVLLGFIAYYPFRQLM
jgi:predicted membrane-bound dolichyl-phosphate-mannose-protein mannosyltransferase